MCKSKYKQYNFLVYTQSEPLAQTCSAKMTGLALRVAWVPVQLSKKIQSKATQDQTTLELSCYNYRISGDATDTPVLRLTIHEPLNFPLEHVTRVGFCVMVMVVTCTQMHATDGTHYVLKL